MKGTIQLYTDGAASGNPGPGGLGVVLLYGKLRKEISEGYELTTNNRMELLAVIRGLEAIKWKNADVTVYTDSKYVADSVNKNWVFGWENKQFKKRKNSDLWILFLELYRKHKIKFQWIKAHNNNPENERCDRLAVQGYHLKSLFKDSGYANEEELLL
jgi:ribonuclease HI